MSQELSKNLKEVNVILDLLGDAYKDKLPKKLKKLFKEDEDKSYDPGITIADFRAGRMLKDTKTILAILYVNYWAGLEQKTEFMDELRAIDKKYEEEHKLVLNEIFPKVEPYKKVESNIEPNIEETQITEAKKSGIAQKIIEILEKIKAIFNK